MNKWQKRVQQSFLDSEKKVLKKLEQNYKEALADIDDKIAILLGRDDKDLTNVIYQVEHQKALKTQVQAILEQLQNNEFKTVSEYLANSYTDGFIGTMYDLHGQDIPLIVPIDQKQVVAAIKHETMLNNDLYTSMGKDIKNLQKNIASEISRGISTGLGYADIARNIALQTNIPKNNAMRIARTESHRISCKASLDAQREAKANGADIVKQWDSTLDGNTRKSHRKLDGQIRNINELFEVDGHKARFPGDFGRPEEDCNCRCAILQRAKWNLDENELNTLKERAAYFELDKTEQFEDFKKKYLKTLERVRESGQMMNDSNKQSFIELIENKVNSMINKINEHKPIELSKLDNEHQPDIMKIYNNAPQNIKRINGKYANAIKFINEKYIGTAKTTKKGICINIINDSTDKRGAWTATFHEIGHMIDRESGDIVKKHPQFKDLLFIDFEDVVKNYQKVYNLNEKEAYKEISKALRTHELHSVSDIVGGITDNECVGLYKHKVDYWSKPYKLEKEAFAHFYEATARNDSAKLKAIKDMFPNAYAEFERMVDEI